LENYPDAYYVLVSLENDGQVVRAFKITAAGVTEEPLTPS
jgi:hypothetical protein